jgi:hypothetical protein
MTFTKEQVKNMANVRQVFQLKRLHESNGGFFFKEDTMRSFSSRIHSDVYGGCVFVTSEKNCSWRYEYPRLYTVRYMDSTGNTRTVGEFQGFETRSKAHAFAKNIGIEIEQIRNAL